MLFKKGSPLVVKQRAVCLEIIFNALVGLLVLLFELDDLAEELQTQQGWLAALPREHYLVAVLPLDVLSDVGFKNFVGDLELTLATQERLFVEVITVGALKIADCTYWFDHRVVGT